MQTLAAVTAVSTEAIAKGKLNAPEEDGEDESEPMDWTAVAQGTGLNFARDSTALTLRALPRGTGARNAQGRVTHMFVPPGGGSERATERLAKPRVSPAAHREMIKHLPKMAKHHYSTATVGGSKWRAGAATSLAVLRSPVFYVMRSTCALLADVAVDAMRVAYGTLSEESFQTTSSWRRRPTTGARLPATAPLGPTARGLRSDSDRSCVLQRAAAPAWMRSTASSACACVPTAQAECAAQVPQARPQLRLLPSLRLPAAPHPRRALPPVLHHLGSGTRPPPPAGSHRRS